MGRVFKKSKIVGILDEIPSVIKKIYQTKDDKKLEFYIMRDSALFCLLYLTGGRVGEVLRLKKRDFEIIRVGGIKFLIVEMYTEKHRKHPMRNVPINMEKEMELLRPIFLYLDKLRNKDKLFAFTIQRAWQIIGGIICNYKKRYKNKFMNANHFLRHCRLTHLVTMHDFTDQDLVRFVGWTNSVPATTYTHLRFKDLAKKML